MWGRLFGIASAERLQEDAGRDIRPKAEPLVEPLVYALFVDNSAANSFLPQRLANLTEEDADFFAVREELAKLLGTPLADYDSIVVRKLQSPGHVLWYRLNKGEAFANCGFVMAYHDGRFTTPAGAIEITWPQPQLLPALSPEPSPQAEPVPADNSNSTSQRPKRARRATAKDARGSDSAHYK